MSEPLTGSCACCCHCKRCQRRSGTLWSLNAMLPGDGFRIVAGEEHVGVWKPDDGIPKAFCSRCGGQLYSDGGDHIGVRLRTLAEDPGIRPEWHQWLESAPDWEPVPDDGLPRFDRARP